VTSSSEVFLYMRLVIRTAHGVQVTRLRLWVRLPHASAISFLSCGTCKKDKAAKGGNTRKVRLRRFFSGAGDSPDLRWRTRRDIIFLLDRTDCQLVTPLARRAAMAISSAISSLPRYSLEIETSVRRIFHVSSPRFSALEATGFELSTSWSRRMPA
jgi:hypothetical protein